MWERLKFTERFDFVNKSKVIHIVVDDVIDSTEAKKEMWYVEELQTQKGVEMVMEWNKHSQELSYDDLFISADVDEVMSRKSLLQLRWCQTSGPLITGALWMPLGRLDRAMKSDFPVVGRPHTYGLPTIYKWETIVKGKYSGARLQVYFPYVAKTPRNKYVAGGIHLTNAAFLPNFLIKEISATETEGYMAGNLRNLTIEEVEMDQAALYQFENKRFWFNRTDPIESATDVQKYIPWFLECNKERFPYWFGNTDPRNYQLLEVLRRY